MRLFQFLILASLLALAATSRSLAQEQSLVPAQGVVLLHNGELICGTVTPLGDRYEVIDRETEMYLKKSDVALVARDAHECYLYRRTGCELGRAQDHVDLATWCLNHGLLEEAGAELADADAADPTFPKIALVKRRLELAQDTSQPSETPVRAEKPPSGEQLDRLTRTLPVGAMEAFTNSVQPLLLNHCSKSGCHGPQSTGLLRLERMPLAKNAGRRPTQRNLQAALAMIDSASPSDSKLLQVPIQPHANLAMPIFTDREQAQYKQLVQWVFQVSGVRTSAPTPSLAGRGAPLLQTFTKPAEKTNPGPRDWNSIFPDQVPESNAKDSPTGSSKPDLPAAEKSGTLAPSKQPNGDAHFVPRDPFDPEIFNRQFSGR